MQVEPKPYTWSKKEFKVSLRNLVAYISPFSKQNFKWSKDLSVISGTLNSIGEEDGRIYGLICTGRLCEQDTYAKNIN